MQVLIKKYTKEQIPEVVMFERRLREEEDVYGWDIDEAYIKNLEKSFDDNRFGNALSFIAYIGDKVVGRIDATLLPSYCEGDIKAYLDWICVLKSYRHQGIAQILLGKLKEELRDMKILDLIAMIASNEESLKFYQSIPNAKIRDQRIWIRTDS